MRSSRRASCPLQRTRSWQCKFTKWLSRLSRLSLHFCPLIQRQDRALAVQLRTAASSMVLNIAESEYSDPGNRRARLFTAAGSTNESSSAVPVAIAGGDIPAERADEVLARLDRVMAILWKLTHGP